MTLAVILGLGIWALQRRSVTQVILDRALAVDAGGGVASGLATGAPGDGPANEAGHDAGARGAESVRDRALRDRIREAIVRAWTLDAGGRPAEPTARSVIPVNTGRLDPSYLRARIREDFLPLARSCYESLQTRRPDAGGRVAMEFEIVADAELGGLVEDARAIGDAAPDAGVWEGEFLTCMRESLFTIAFIHPHGNGRLTVRYPFTFSPLDDAGRD